MTKRRLRYKNVAPLLLGVVFGLALGGVSTAEEQHAPTMLPGSGSTTGALEYRSHCAQCHGMEGKGDGPVAAVLTKKPGDLTQLAKKNAGSFPEEKVVAFIDGSEMVAAHGTREMPIWGLEFATVSGTGGARRGAQQVRQRIDLLVSYLKSIQEK